jgi:phosphoenolpyruvate synthase/pyruvate phosphate dikinase
LAARPPDWRAYPARQHISPADVSLAVVVQRLVPAEVAGVLFTAHPALSPTLAARPATARSSPASTTIPAVLGTGAATERIRSGQRITVDGDAGTLQL